MNYVKVYPLIFLLAIVSCNRDSKGKTSEKEISAGQQTEVLENPDTPLIRIDKINIPQQHLKGKQQLLEKEFVEMNGYASIQKTGDYMIFMNASARTDYIFLIYTLPDFKFHKKFLKYGYGPNEFTNICVNFYPNPKKGEDIGYVFDSENGSYYSISSDFSIKEKKKFKDLGARFLESLHFLDDSTVVYLSMGGKGRFLFQYKESTTYPGFPLIDLQILPDVDFFYTYGISFKINPEKNRILYGYLFFNELHVRDLKGNLLRRITGPDKNRKINSNDLHVWLDNLDRPMYYKTSFSTGSHFYIHYWDESTIGEYVRKENKQQTIIRKFDWNGNPICEFILDKTIGNSQFLVDEENKRIYILSSTEDDPLYIYTYD